MNVAATTQPIRAAVLRSLPVATSLILAAVLIHQVMSIAGLLRESSAPMVAPLGLSAGEMRAATPHADSSLDIAAAHLFGVASSEQTAALDTPTLSAAPPSTLSADLTGVLYSQEEAASRIILVSAGVVRSYAVGDRIDGAGDTVLRAVFLDGAVIAREGRLETLRLPNAGAAIPAPEPQPDATARRPRNAGADAPYLAAAPAPAAGPTGASPIRLLRDVVNVAPRRVVTGAGIAFALNFREPSIAGPTLGLKSGAQVVSVNGVGLGSDPVAGPRLFREALGNATSATIEVVNSDATSETIVLDSSLLARR